MAREDIIVGLEIGTSKVCAVVGETRHDGTVKILGVGQAPSRGVRKGEIVDFDTAGKCVREALVDAEEKSDVAIHSVFLAVAGGHIRSFNNRGAVSIPEDREEICDEDFEDVQAAAREVSIPQPNMFLHSILQHYYVDGQDGVLNPIGMMGSKLEADFHIIHGVGTRIKNTVRCVKELDIDVEDVVFAPLAAAQVVLDLNQKNLGALVIDMGGGTTGYVVYLDGAVKQSGCLAIGGDHITNDLSLGLRIPMAKAERIKIEEGSVILGNPLPHSRDLRADQTRDRHVELSRFSWRRSAAHGRLFAAQGSQSSRGRDLRNAGTRDSRANRQRRNFGFREPAVLDRDRSHQIRAGDATAAAARLLFAHAQPVQFFRTLVTPKNTNHHDRTPPPTTTCR